MQPTHFIILVLSIVLTASLVRIAIKAFAKDRARQFAEGQAAGRVEGRSEVEGLINKDLQLLLEITNTLQLAHKTWLSLPGTEPYRGKVITQLDELRKVALRIRDQGPTQQAESVDPSQQERAA